MPGPPHARADRTFGLARGELQKIQLAWPDEGIDAPICQDMRSGGLGAVLAHAEVCHNALVEFTGKEAFEASNDLALGPAISGAACDIVDGRLVKPHPDDDGSIEGGVGLAVAAPIQAVPASGPPRGGRDRTRAAALRKGGFRANTGGVITAKDQQLGGGVRADPVRLEFPMLSLTPGLGTVAWRLTSA